jgi:hypothetical protein
VSQLEITPTYVKIKIPYTSPASIITQKKEQIIRIKDEIKFLYKKKLNNELCIMHPKAAQEWGKYLCITCMLDSIQNSKNQEIEKNIEPLMKNLRDSPPLKQKNPLIQVTFTPVSSTKTDIIFSYDESALLNKGLMYNLHHKYTNWIKTLSIEAEPAITLHLCTNKTTYTIKLHTT